MSDIADQIIDELLDDKLKRYLVWMWYDLKKSIVESLIR